MHYHKFLQSNNKKIFLKILAFREKVIAVRMYVELSFLIINNINYEAFKINDSCCRCSVSG